MGKTRHDQDKLPGRCEELVRLMPLQAIADDIQLDNTIEMIDRIMAIAKRPRARLCTSKPSRNSLTADHLRKLTERSHVGASLFL